MRATKRYSLILIAIMIAAVLLMVGTLIFAVGTPAMANAAEADEIPNATEPHDHDADNMTAIGQAQYNALTNGTLNEGTYYLSENISGNIKVSSTVTLCLNGKTITGSGNDSVIYLKEGAKFTLCDCTGAGVITGGNAEFGGGVRVNNNNTEFTMTGGTISGNSAYWYGWGVYVGDGGKFTMTGGAISGNTRFEGDGLGGYGGGVAVYGTFIMEGGAINENDTLGIYIKQGNVTMSGGEICDNTGNGVIMDYMSSFTMTDGRICGNTASVGYPNGGGVFVGSYGSFTISGTPNITGNKSKSDGLDSNVYLSNDNPITVEDALEKDGNKAQIGITVVYNFAVAFTSGYGENCLDENNKMIAPSKYFISDNDGLVPVPEGDEAKLVNGIATVQVGDEITTYGRIIDAWLAAKAASDAAIVTLFADVTTNYTAPVNENDDITLDLNGRIFKFTGSDGSVIEIAENGTFTLTDSRPQVGHRYNINEDGLWVFDDHNGEHIFRGGAVTGGKGTNSDGGVYVKGGKFIMNGGAISGNTGYNGGVCVESTYNTNGQILKTQGMFTMNGGKICGNVATIGGGVSMERNGVFTMSDGAVISDNTAIDRSGGVHLSDTSTFTMTGGTICNNTKVGNNSFPAGGVFFAGGATFNVSGTPNITGNKAGGVESNVYMWGSPLTVTGKLENANGSKKAQIGITRYYGEGVFTSGYGDDNSSAAPYKYFISDNPQYAVTLDGTEVKLAPAVASVAYGDGNAEKFATVKDAFTYVNTLSTTENNSAEITLLKDVTTAMINVANVKINIVLDLNGKTLKGDGEKPVICVQNSNPFTLTDSNKTAPHDYYVDEANGGIWVFVDEDFENAENYEIKTLYGGVITGGVGESGVSFYSGTFEMDGGNICGNEGGVYIGGGEFIMTDGAICGNYDKNYGGGGVYVNYGNFYLKGGKICDNKATYGGGVYVYGGNFYMSGGKICGNKADEGGGVYIGGGTFKMTGGNICGNTSSYGGGVCFVSGSFNISGVPVIKDNYNRNVYLERSTVTVIGELEDGAHIGISKVGAVATDYYQDDKPSEFFIPDNSANNCIYANSGTVTIGTHEADSVWSVDTETHYHACSNGCGEKLDVTAHNYDQEVVSGTYLNSAATCTAKAVYFKSCVCGAYGEETFEYGGLAAHTHGEAVSENEVAATCTTAGSYDEVVYCSVCEEELSRTAKTTPIDPDAHSFGEWTVTKPATETEEGEEQRVCSRDDTHVETRPIAKLTPEKPAMATRDIALIVIVAILALIVLCEIVYLIYHAINKNKDTKKQ